MDALTYTSKSIHKVLGQSHCHNLLSRQTGKSVENAYFDPICKTNLTSWTNEQKLVDACTHLFQYKYSQSFGTNPNLKTFLIDKQVRGWELLIFC